MQYTKEQVMLTLAFISYLGFYEISSDLKAFERTLSNIEKALKELPPVAGDWDIVWGPAHYKLPLTIFDQNLMFVVRHRCDRARYAIVIRGTNPVSLTNWLLEDFAILLKTPWPYDAHGSGLKPKISKAAATGLQALQGMKPVDGIPGAGMNLYQLLAHEVRNNPGPRLDIAVTGHSLGGALAPTVALWLADTQKTSDDPESAPWDPEGKANIEVYPFAGPSPGDRDFARYYDQKLGARTRRMWNEFDVVPHGWVGETLAKLPGLYSPKIAPDRLMSFILWSTTILARRGDYLQILSDVPPLDGGSVHAPLSEYLAQMIYQHTAAYPDLLRLHAEIDTTRHFELDDLMKSVMRSARTKRLGDSAANGEAASTPAAAAAPVSEPRRIGGTVAKGLERAYHVSATVVHAMLPQFMTMSRLRTRRSHYRNRRAAAPA